jgi:hypothetical protein
MLKLHVGGADRLSKPRSALHHLVTAFSVKKALTVGGQDDVRQATTQASYSQPTAIK